MSTRKALWYSIKALRSSKDLKDDMKKGHEKVKALISRYSKDSDENVFWREHVMMVISVVWVTNQFCLLLMKCHFQVLIILFVVFWPHVETNKHLQWQRQCNKSFPKKQSILLVLFNDIIHLRQFSNLNQSLSRTFLMSWQSTNNNYLISFLYYITTWAVKKSDYQILQVSKPCQIQKHSNT